MLKSKWLLVAVLILFVSCKSKNALHYNNEFVNKENSLETDIKTTEGKVAVYMANQQYDSVGSAGEKMEQIVENKILEIEKEAVPSVKGGDEFKKAWLKYFGFIKSCYTNYKQFGYAKTDTEREEKMQLIRDFVTKAKDAVNELQSAQKKFAGANNFKLEEKTF